jgi:hypothetical protein
MPCESAKKQEETLNVNQPNFQTNKSFQKTKILGNLFALHSVFLPVPGF